MSSSLLAELVGNDPRKVDELVTLFAGLFHACLAAIHKEDEDHVTAHERPP